MKQLFTILMSLTLLTQVKGQDVHFAHIHASPILLNPSMSGLFDGQIRFIGNARNQWKEASSDFFTGAVSADFKLLRFSGGYLGSSINFMNDKAGDLAFTQNASNVSLAAAKSIGGGTNYLAVGIQGGLLSHHVDYTNLNVFDDEPYLNTASSATSAQTIDIGAGATWWYRVNDDVMFYTGVSSLHINEPHISIIGVESTQAETIYNRRTVHIGSEFDVSSNVTLMPSLLAMQQGPHSEFLGGTFLKYKKPSGSKLLDELYWGTWVRWYDGLAGYGTFDAVILTARLDKGPASFSFSYDINLSSLMPASEGRGGPEISAILILEKVTKGFGNQGTNAFGGKRGNLDCPKF